MVFLRYCNAIGDWYVSKYPIDTLSNDFIEIKSVFELITLRLNLCRPEVGGGKGGCGKDVCVELCELRG